MPSPPRPLSPERMGRIAILGTGFMSSVLADAARPAVPRQLGRGLIIGGLEG